MSTIQVSCIDQVLTMTNTPVIASGGIKEDRVAFTFCPMWDGYYKTAVFWRTEDEVYNQVLDDTNSCDIPPEVLGTEGVLYFGVFGVNDEEAQRTSEVLRYTIERGAITEGGKPSDPTPDIYTQLLAKIAAMGDNKGKADKVSSAAEGNFAGLDANGNLTDSGANASDFILATEKAAAGGVASLGTDGKVPAGQLPAMDYAAKTHASQHSASGTDPVTPAAIGAVSKAGDTMSGPLSVAGGYCNFTGDNTALILQHILNGNRYGFVVYPEYAPGDRFKVFTSIDGNLMQYRVLHDGNLSDNNISRLAMITYTGTGTYGSANPTTITCPGEPKMVIVVNKGESLEATTEPEMLGWCRGFLWMYGAATVDIGRLSNTTLKFTLSGNTLSWYTSSDQYNQYNNSGQVYYAFVWY